MIFERFIGAGRGWCAFKFTKNEIFILKSGAKGFCAFKCEKFTLCRCARNVAQKTYVIKIQIDNHKIPLVIAKGSEMRQMSFSFLKQYNKEFGGSLLIGKKKTRRPLSTKNPIHLILKTGRAKLFHPANNDLVKIIRSDAQKFDVKIYNVAVNWSHIHLLIQLPSRDAYNRLIRSVTSRLVAYFERKSGWDLKGIFDQCNGPALIIKLSVKA